MTIRHTLLAALIVLAAIATGCSSAQTVNINSNPAGAEVQLKLKGQREYKASMDGVGSTSSPRSRFEDEFFTLGSTPATYTFELEQTEKSSRVMGFAKEETKRKYDSGTVRISRPGYKTIERDIRFEGGKLELNFELETER